MQCIARTPFTGIINIWADGFFFKAVNNRPYPPLNVYRILVRLGGLGQLLLTSRTQQSPIHTPSANVHQKIPQAEVHAVHTCTKRAQAAVREKEPQEKCKEGDPPRAGDRTDRGAAWR